MTEIEGDSRYADVFERALYNGVLSGVSLDGTRYFYVNPLEAVPDAIASRQDHEHVKGARAQWNACACCPPNIARMVASVASYIYGASEDSFWVHQYTESEAALSLMGTKLRVTQKTDYPWSGAIPIAVHPEREVEFCLMLRIPAWCSSFACDVNGRPVSNDARVKGYLKSRRLWKDGDRVELKLRMEPRVLCADPKIPELAGKLAIQRGPLVYCVESCDNGEGFHSLDPGSRGRGRLGVRRSDDGRQCPRDRFGGQGGDGFVGFRGALPGCALQEILARADHRRTVPPVGQSGPRRRNAGLASVQRVTMKACSEKKQATRRPRVFDAQPKGMDCWPAIAGDGNRVFDAQPRGMDCWPAIAGDGNRVFDAQPRGMDCWPAIAGDGNRVFDAQPDYSTARK